MKLEAKDLRIGNIVIDGFAQSHGFENYLCQVSSIMDNEDIRARNITGGQASIIRETLYGVPLTEEWLIKFGFEQNEYGFYKLDFLGMCFLYKHNYGFSFCKKHIEIECYTDFTVHQLQNLYFALTNEELILNP